MEHTKACLKFGKVDGCPVCKKITELRLSGYTSKQITKIMSEDRYIHDLRTISGKIIQVYV